jgi:hypothetical protein
MDIAHVAQQVERHLGKVEVTSSNLAVGSKGKYIQYTRNSLHD